VALLEKRRFLYNHSGDFPQVILIVPSHVPNNIYPCLSGFLECKIYRTFGFALFLAFHSIGDVLDFEYEGLRVFGDPLRMVHFGCGFEVSLFYIVQFFIFLKTTPGVEPRLRLWHHIVPFPFKYCLNTIFSVHSLQSLREKTL
jgi:hypothetical protein